MIRMVIFLAALLALALGLSWLADQPGNVSLNFGGVIYETSLMVAALGCIAISLLLMFAWGLCRFLLRFPSLMALSNRMRRRSKGLNAVANGMIAVGSGDARTASRQSSEASRLLGHEPLTLLLKAQAAQLSGKRPEAEAAFNKMLEIDETRILGLRGLFVEARRKGDMLAARQYAAQAHEIAPSIPWAGQSILEYASADGDWTQALKVVDNNTSRHILAKPEANRQRAILLCAKALDLSERSPDEAFQLALNSLKLEPGLVPAAVLAAKNLSCKGNYNRASKILEAAWKQGPHPALSEVYLDVRRGDSALDRLKRAKNIANILPDNRESRFIIASAALDAKEFQLARENLDLLVLEKPTTRACLLMAELEEQEFNRAGIMREWLARAARAPRDPAWVADGHVSEYWAPASPITGRLDAYQWHEPPQSIVANIRTTLDANITMNQSNPVEAITSQQTKFMDNQIVDLERAGVTPTGLGLKSSVETKTTGSTISKGVFSKPQPIIFPIAHAPDDPGSATPIKR